jgi:hypothetical protein
LIRFGFKNDGLSIEAVIKKDFIRWKILETRVSKDETVVNVSDVSDEQVVIGQDLLEIN